MGDTFFTSDLHYGHSNIIPYCSRPFKSAEEMDEALIANWNVRVTANDVVIVLGDFSLKKASELENIFRRLNGAKCLIKGNHDNDDACKKLKWQWVKDVHMYNVKGQHIFLSHYPHRSWPRSGNGAWHLHGHVHSTFRPFGKSLDVGADAWDYTPVSFGEVCKVMDKLPKFNKNVEGLFMPKGHMFKGRQFNYNEIAKE
jgi:calcineurin-like phosphoesterase family protein